LAVADEDHGPGFPVQDHPQGALAVANADLVDGDLLPLLQPRLLEAVLQVPLLDVLDGVPANPEVPRHIPDGHAPAQLQGVTLESLGVAAPRVGKRQRHLGRAPTGAALDRRDGQDEPDGRATDGHRWEGAWLVAVVDEFTGVALRATTGVGPLAHGKDDGSCGELGLDVVVAPQAEGVVQ
jgi:hypothetical protein